MIFNFGAGDAALPSVASEGNWTVELRSADSRWLGPNRDSTGQADPTSAIALPGQSFIVLSRESGA